MVQSQNKIYKNSAKNIAKNDFAIFEFLTMSLWDFNLQRAAGEG